VIRCAVLVRKITFHFWSLKSPSRRTWHLRDATLPPLWFFWPNNSGPKFSENLSKWTVRPIIWRVFLKAFYCSFLVAPVFSVNKNSNGSTSARLTEIFIKIPVIICDYRFNLDKFINWTQKAWKFKSLSNILGGT
jgi:hypothetical protein